MNVTDQWMLERMQQMAASMAASVPQTSQDDPKADKAESFQDMMNKAKDQKVEVPKKTEAPKKADAPQKTEPVQKTENKAVTNMKDPRIQALDPATQAQIAAGFLTPIEMSDGSLLLRIDAMPSAVVTPLLPNGQPDWSKPIVLINSDGEQFEVYLDPEKDDCKLFQLMDSGEKKPIDLFPEQPKPELLNDSQKLDMTVIMSEDKMAANETGDEEESDLNAEIMTTSQPLFHDVKTAPVKVGENFELDTQQADMDEQLAETIQFAAQQGLKQIEIKLSPENLGNLTIRLTQASDGSLQVILHAANAKAVNLLNQHLDNLNAALQGYSQNSEVQVQVQRGEDSQQAQQQQYQQADPDGHNRQQQQQQQQQQDNGRSEDFIQRLRLGLFGLDD